MNLPGNCKTAFEKTNAYQTGRFIKKKKETVTRYLLLLRQPVPRNCVDDSNCWKAKSISAHGPRYCHPLCQDPPVDIPPVAPWPNPTGCACSLGLFLIPFSPVTVPRGNLYARLFLRGAAYRIEGPPLYLEKPLRLGTPRRHTKRLRALAYPASYSTTSRWQIS